MASSTGGGKGAPPSKGKRKGKFDKFFGNTKAKKLRQVKKHNGENALRVYKDYQFANRIGGPGQKGCVLPPEAQSAQYGEVE